MRSWVLWTIFILIDLAVILIHIFLRYFFEFLDDGLDEIAFEGVDVAGDSGEQAWFFTEFVVLLFFLILEMFFDCQFISIGIIFAFLFIGRSLPIDKCNPRWILLDFPVRNDAVSNFLDLLVIFCFLYVSDVKANREGGCEVCIIFILSRIGRHTFRGVKITALEWSSYYYYLLLILHSVVFQHRFVQLTEITFLFLPQIFVLAEVEWD